MTASAFVGLTTHEFPSKSSSEFPGHNLRTMSKLRLGNLTCLIRGRASPCFSNLSSHHITHFHKRVRVTARDKRRPTSLRKSPRVRRCVGPLERTYRCTCHQAAQDSR